MKKLILIFAMMGSVIITPSKTRAQHFEASVSVGNVSSLSMAVNPLPYIGIGVQLLKGDGYTAPNAFIRGIWALPSSNIILNANVGYGKVGDKANPLFSAGATSKCLCFSIGGELKLYKKFYAIANVGLMKGEIDESSKSYVVSNLNRNFNSIYGNVGLAIRL